MSSAGYKWWKLHEYKCDSELAEQMRMSAKMPYKDKLKEICITHVARKIIYYFAMFLLLECTSLYIAY